MRGLTAFDVGGAEPELVERARPVRLQKHVRFCRELAQDLDCLGLLEIEHQAALVAVERDEAHALAVADRRRGAAHVALRRLDLDDVGAHVGEQRAGERTGDEIRQLDDPDPRQRLWHVAFLSRCHPRRRASSTTIVASDTRDRVARVYWIARRGHAPIASAADQLTESSIPPCR